MFINTGTHRICWWILVNQWAWIKTYRVTTELLEPSKGKCSVRTHSPMKNVWPFHETKICSKKATTEREFSVESLKEFWIFFFSVSGVFLQPPFQKQMTNPLRLYGCETWPLTLREDDKIERFKTTKPTNIWSLERTHKPTITCRTY